MKTKFLILIIIGVLIISSVILAADIQYPVAELGNCENKTDCRAYCNELKNTEDCLDFARKNNLMSEDEIERAERFLAASGEGPGGCAGEDECKEYCNDINHIDECISFAERNGLIPPEELEEAKKVQAAIARGVKPPPCGNKQQCDVYCEEPEHMEECIAFGLEAGFIQGKEAEDAQKMLQAVKRGVKPPPCKGKEACDEYCSSPDNMEVCMTFAMEAGFMSEQEKEDSQKMLQALKKGIKPPPCKGKEDCDAYCGSEEHFEECTNFAVAAGFMSEKDAGMARKTGGKGPGDCKGKEECENFCNNPDNQETCFNFAKNNGLIPEEDLRKMEEGKQQLQQSLQQMPQEVADCLSGEVGADMVEKMKSGFMPPREAGDKMQGCFQKMGPPQGPDQQGPPCEGEDCKKFQSGPVHENPGGQIMPQQAGPGGCKTPEECQSFCQNNPEECKNLSPGSANQQGPGPGQMPPCEGENCQQGPPSQQPEGYQPPQDFRPPEGQMPPEGQQFQPPLPGEPASQLPPLPEQQQQPPAEPPPPPPPPEAFLKPDTFLGAALYVIAKALYSVSAR